MLPAQAAFVHIGAHGEEHLAGDHQTGTAIVLQAAAQELLRLTAAISVGTVEEIHALVIGQANRILRHLRSLAALQVGHPAAQRHLTYLQAGRAYIAILHK